MWKQKIETPYNKQLFKLVEFNQLKNQQRKKLDPKPLTNTVNFRK